MKVMISVLALLGLLGSALGNLGLNCNVPPKDSSNSEKVFDMVFAPDSDCVKGVKNHIKVELEASLTYIGLGAHFLSADNYRPGVAKLFLDHAGEERTHAKALMDYLTMRGVDGLDLGFPDTVDLKLTARNITGISSVMDGLELARDLEKIVRDEFKKIIKTCDETNDKRTFSDYHLSDVLTGEFLDEQHRSVKELTSSISVLKRLMSESGSALAEFEFDRTLLKD